MTRLEKDSIPSRAQTSEEHQRLIQIAREFSNLKQWVSLNTIISEESEFVIGDISFHHLGPYEKLSHQVHGTSVAISHYDLKDGKPFQFGKWAFDSIENGIYAELCALGYLRLVLMIVDAKLGNPTPKPLMKYIAVVIKRLTGELPTDRLLSRRQH